MKLSINGASLVVHIKVWTPGALDFQVAVPWGDVVFSFPPLSFPRLAPCLECLPLAIILLKYSRVLLEASWMDSSTLFRPHPKGQAFVSGHLYSFGLIFFLIRLGWRTRTRWPCLFHESKKHLFNNSFKKCLLSPGWL